MRATWFEDLEQYRDAQEVTCSSGDVANRNAKCILMRPYAKYIATRADLRK